MHSKINILTLIRNFYIFSLIIYSGLGIEYFRENSGMFFLLILSLIVSVFYKFNTISKNIVIIISIWIVYSILNTISIRSFHPVIFIYFPILFFSAYIAIKLYNEKIFYKIESIIYYLAIISLFFYVWQLIDSGSLFNIAQKININPPTDIGNLRIKYNFIIYNINHMDNWALPRNSGYCWEPGPFGCFIVLSIFLNQIRTEFSIANNKRFWIFFIALLTTQSTTAFVAFFIVVLWILLNKKRINKLVVILLPLTLLIIMAVFINTPFLQEKIIGEFSQTDEIDKYVLLSMNDRYGDAYAPGRFASFIITWKDFIARPLFGFGGNSSLQWTEQAGAVIAPVSGIGNLLARYGVFVFIGWIFLLVKSSRFINSLYENAKFKFVWILLVLMLAFAFSVVFSPVFLIIYLMPFYFKNISR